MMMRPNKPNNDRPYIQRLWFGLYHFDILEDTTIDDVLDCIQDWAEQSVYFRKQIDYHGLAAFFDIPKETVKSIENQAYNLFSPRHM